MKEVEEVFQQWPGRWVAGVSGGPDSMVLLYIMLKAGLKPVVAHVNYGLRAEESDKDEELVRSFSAEHGLSFYCKRAEIAPGGNFQDKASAVRYKWFEQIRNQIGYDYIATAHHRDDNLETVLFRLMRGSGIDELSGIAKIKSRIIRPMLKVTKEDILNYAGKNNIPFRIDRSNLSSEYARNFIRNEIIPLLDKQYPDWREKMDDTMKLSQMYHQMVKELAEPLINKGNLDFEGLGSLEPNKKKMVLSWWVRGQTGLKTSRSWLDSAIETTELSTGRKLSISQDWFIIRDRDSLVIRRNQAAPSPVSLEMSMLETGSEIKIDNLVIKLGEWSGKPDSSLLELDAMQLKWPLKLRPWRNGDRIIPLGLGGSQLVSDLLTNKKIPADRKRECLVIVSFEQKVCAVIFAHLNQQTPGVISQEAACTDLTKKTLVISGK